MFGTRDDHFLKGKRINGLGIIITAVMYFSGTLNKFTGTTVFIFNAFVFEFVSGGIVTHFSEFPAQGRRVRLPFSTYQYTRNADIPVLAGDHSGVERKNRVSGI